MLSTFCLALVIYVEARGEPVDGQYMVADVVINRVEHEWWPEDVCSVVFDDAQFSGISNKIDLQTVFNDPSWSQSVIVATEALNGSDLGSGATHFHKIGSKPYWSNHLILLGQYGNHMFYREDER